MGPERAPRGLGHRLLGVACLCLVMSASLAYGQRSFGDPLAQLGTAAGYALEVHASGLSLPTALAFVPEPDEGEGAPLYFVAELQGGVNVVTRGGDVHTFATVPTYGRQARPLSGTSQQGLAGLCLAPEHGYVFATFTEPDDGGILRNRIVRFSSVPVTFGLAATGAVELLPALAEFQSAPAHQVGDCIVVGDSLYVGVGDGGAPRAAADRDVLLGKVLCLDLDGQPCADPPFGSRGPASYVYATGFRNPFAIAHDGTRLVVAENGVNIDRFVPVSRGLDHLWDGTDAALAAHAELVFAKPFSPVQLAYVPPGAAFMEPGWAGHYVASGFGSRDVPAGLSLFGGARTAGMAATPPRYLVQYLGLSGGQHFAGVAVGPDGLYLTPMLPLGDLGGVVLRLRYDPAVAHTEAAKPTWGLAGHGRLPVLEDLGCTGCHSVAGTGGGIGPVLDQFSFNYRITEHLNSLAYEADLRALMAAAERDDLVNEAREEVLAAAGRERTSVWLYHMLLNPRFDDPDRQMPDLGLTPEQARAAREELFAALKVDVGSGSWWQAAWQVFLRNWRELGVGALAGATGTLALLRALGLRQPVADRDPRRTQTDPPDRGGRRPLPVPGARRPTEPPLS